MELALSVDDLLGLYGIPNYTKPNFIWNLPDRFTVTHIFTCFRYRFVITSKHVADLFKYFPELVFFTCDTIIDANEKLTFPERVISITTSSDCSWLGNANVKSCCWYKGVNSEFLTSTSINGKNLEHLEKYNIIKLDLEDFVPIQTKLESVKVLNVKGTKIKMDELLYVFPNVERLCLKCDYEPGNFGKILFFSGRHVDGMEKYVEKSILKKIVGFGIDPSMLSKTKRNRKKEKSLVKYARGSRKVVTNFDQ